MSIQDEIRRAINDTLGPIITALTKPQGAPSGAPMQAPPGYNNRPVEPLPSRAEVARMLTMNKYYLDDQRLDQIYQWVQQNHVHTESTILGYVDGVFFPAIRRTR